MPLQAMKTAVVLVAFLFAMKFFIKPVVFVPAPARSTNPRSQAKIETAGYAAKSKKERRTTLLIEKETPPAPPDKQVIAIVEQERLNALVPSPAPQPDPNTGYLNPAFLPPSERYSSLEDGAK